VALVLPAALSAAPPTPVLRWASRPQPARRLAARGRGLPRHALSHGQVLWRGDRLPLPGPPEGKALQQLPDGGVHRLLAGPQAADLHRRTHERSGRRL
jgi:hypothetical protein